jgi:integrase/recombinase XerD
MNKPSVNIEIERRRIHETGPNRGKAHIKIWITFTVVENGKKVWKQRPYKTNLFCSLDDFVIVQDKKVKRVPTHIKDIRDELIKLEGKANHIINDLKVTDQKRFELFFESEYEVETIQGQFEYKVADLLGKKKPRISTAEKYLTALASLQDFSNDKLTFNEINQEWLEEYVDWYIKPDENGKSRSITSAGINLRHLRAIFKQAISLHIISPDIYPFGHNKFVIPEGQEEVKKFLEPAEKDLFLKFKSDNRNWMYYHDFGVFCYYANGINFADILNLKRHHDKGGYFQIERQKTKGKKKKIKRMIIVIHPVIREVMARRGNHSLAPNDYIFPILNDSMSEVEKFTQIRNFVKRTDRALGAISDKLKLSVKVTTYVLRHTFSNMFMELGGTTEELQDALSHGDIRTTENYKHGFALARKKRFSEGL